MNEQELFWKGEFGDEYIDRNDGSDFIASKIDLFIKALKVAKDINSIIELGANRGLNANALKSILPNSHFTGVEISDKAYKLLNQNPDVDSCCHASIHTFDTEEKYDLAIIAGVMIHLNPNTLNNVYKQLAKFSSKYVLIAEYYNPTPVSIEYRGHEGKLFKRDFAKEFMDKTGFSLLDYGFLYRHDMKFKHSDITWFLMQK